MCAHAFKPDLTFLPQKRLRLKCQRSTSFSFIRLITMVNTIKACPLAHTIYVGIHIVFSWWDCNCSSPHPVALTRANDCLPARRVGSPQTSGRRILCIWEVGCRVQLMLVLTLVGTPLPRLPVRIPHAVWETQPSFDVPETFPGGLWIGQQSLPLFLMVHGMTSSRDQLYVFRHKALLFFCSTAKCRSYSKWKRRVFLKDTQVVCWFLHSGHFFLEPSYVINCSQSWLRLESAWFANGSEWITDQRMGLL